jgi:hypothetical protein
MGQSTRTHLVVVLLLALTLDVVASKIGGCVNAQPTESRVPVDPYTVSDIYTGSSCAPFAKAINAYGLLFVASTAGQNVPDNGLRWLATAMTELFPASALDLNKQREVLENMYRYRAANPVFVGQFVDNMDPARDALSMCDTITLRSLESSGDTSSQIMEIYEHLLHIITDVGFAYTWPGKWGLTTSSDLHAAMQEAVSNGVYSVSDYAAIDSEARLRIQLQEFAYWALSTSQGVHASHFTGSAAPEWTLTTPSQVQTQLPLFWSLHQSTSATVLGQISLDTMTSLGSLADSVMSYTAPWPIVAAGRGTVPTGDALVDPCEGAGSGVLAEGSVVVVAAAAAAAAFVAVMAASCFRAKRRQATNNMATFTSTATSSSPA